MGVLEIQIGAYALDSALSASVHVSARRHDSGVVAQLTVGLPTQLRSG